MPVLLLPLAVLLAGLVLIALALTAKTWAEALLHVFAAGHKGGILRIITLPAQLLARVVAPGLNYVVHQTTKAASHYTHPIAAWFDSLAIWSAHNAAAVGLFAERVALGFERTTTVVIPREIHKAFRPLDRRTKTAIGLGLGTAAALARYRRGIDRLIREHVAPQLRALERTITQTLPRELGRLRARARALERDIRNPSAAVLRRLAARLWVLGIGALMIRTLARRFPWLFCRKVKTLGKRTCGMDDDLLNALLFETLLFSGTLNLEALARQCQGLVKLGENGLESLIERD